MNTWWKSYLTGPIINAFGRRKERAHFSRPPILIGGCGRSGTTLLLAILSAHPNIFAIPTETDAFTEWESTSRGLEPVRLDRLYRALLRHSIPKSKHRWCEKRPANVHFIPQLLQYFGSEMRFIHLLRDPRAVCTSVHPEIPNQYWVPVERYIQDVSAGLLYREHPQVLTLRYEDIVVSPQDQIRQICEFVGEEPVSEILHWAEHATVKKNRAWFGGLEDMHTRSLMKWSALEHDQRVAEVMADQRIIALMEKCGYH